MRKPGFLWRRPKWRMGGAMCALLAVTSGCASVRPVVPQDAGRLQGSPTSAAAPYQVGPGDTLDVIVWREEQLSGPLQVRPDGIITVALIGDVRAAGLTPDALAAEIRTGLSRFIDEPNVVVRVAATGSRRFYIVGNVQHPGMYEMRPDQTALQAIAVAGGFTDFADRDGARIIRGAGPGTTIAVDFDAVVRGDAPDLRLEPSDTIVVP